MKRLSHKAGFGLVETMMASAAVMGLAVTTFQMIRANNDSSAAVTRLAAWNEAANLVNLVLANKESCLATLTDPSHPVPISLVPGQLSTDYQLTRLVRPLPGGALEPVVTVGELLTPRSNTRISGLSLRTHAMGVAAPEATRFNAELFIQRSETIGSGTARTVTRGFKFYVVTAATGGNVLDCYSGFSSEEFCLSVGGNFDSARTPSCILPWLKNGDLVYNLDPVTALTYNIGLGMTSPQVPAYRLDVQGSAQTSNLYLRPGPAPAAPVEGQMWMEP